MKEYLFDIKNGFSISTFRGEYLVSLVEAEDPHSINGQVNLKYVVDVVTDLELNFTD